MTSPYRAPGLVLQDRASRPRSWLWTWWHGICHRYSLGIRGRVVTERRGDELLVGHVCDGCGEGEWRIVRVETGTAFDIPGRFEVNEWAEEKAMENAQPDLSSAFQAAEDMKDFQSKVHAFGDLARRFGQKAVSRVHSDAGGTVFQIKLPNPPKLPRLPKLPKLSTGDRSVRVSSTMVTRRMSGIEGLDEEADRRAREAGGAISQETEDYFYNLWHSKKG